MDRVAVFSSILVLTFFFEGCASYTWKKESWAKTNFAEAHSDCTAKARIAVGFQNGNYDWGFTGRWNSFMKECMAGQGYTLTKSES